jgi:hypothetical protein
MISAFIADNELHVVYILAREGMTKIAATAMCQLKGDDKLSIYQLPPWVFDGRPKWGETAVCLKCAGSLAEFMKVPPR